MRLKNLRATGLTGALLSTTIIAVAPAVADSDTQSQNTTAAASAPAAAKTAVPPPVATKASSSLTVSSVRRTVIAGKRVVVRGTLRPAGSGRAVALQVRQKSGGGWITVNHDRTNAKGRYVLAWRAAKTGTRRIRVHFGGTRELSSARHQAGTTRVYRRALASWYGPGLYGGHLACGGTLTPGTLGVANKSLPCGTKVTLHYKGRTVRVPVIDRGPYVGAREFDLTAATKTKLGFGSTGTVLTTR
ncbi:septal ring lytic transglycosylase RlpA family protein [Baekduia sp. Peel2402]|uniref:septal ring lytic transglycosylase RlpA family protein n=1 Tax=Baekduia sp. Peel2402 TaxID=3458296 RepID=UPI00403E69D6